MKIVENQTFEAATVELDDTHFRYCTFLGCELRYSGRMAAIENCMISDDCTVFLSDEAYRVAYLLQVLGYLSLENLKKIGKPSKEDIQ